MTPSIHFRKNRRTGSLRPTTPAAASPVGEMRIARFLAAAGVASRRECEKIILAHRVEINGTPIDSPARNLNPQADEVRLDGRIVRLPEPVYLLLYKPPGVTCSARDRHADRLVGELLPDRFGRLFTVGRLDRDSEGLIVCTNDGEFAQKVAHPRHELEKTYRVFVLGKVPGPTLRRLREGVVEGGQELRPESVRRVGVVSGARTVTELEFILKEGKKREIRRLCQSADLPVVRLIRVGLGSLRDPQLAPGQWRLLNKAEIAGLSKRASQ